MSIQNSINQTLGVAAVAAKLSPQLQELGEVARTTSESNRVERQLKKVASKGHIDYDTTSKHDDVYTILDDKDVTKYYSLLAKKEMLDEKKRSLGLRSTDWKELPPRDVLTYEDAADLEEKGDLQRINVERLKEIRNKVREYQFGGKNYGNDKQ